MLFSFALALALMSTPSNETSPICVQRFDAELRPTRAACIEAGGKVSSVHARRDGGLVAMVTRPDGALEVLTWTAEPGSSPSRHNLAVSGEFWGPLLREDGDLTLVVGAEILRARTGDGRIVTRRSSRLPAARAFALAPDGVWLLVEDQLTWAGLDGNERVIPSPSVAPELPVRPRAPVSRVGRDVTPWALQNGDLLIIERIGDRHPVKEGRDDVTVRLGLTRVDRDGRVLGQRIFDETRKHLQWFWSEKSSGNPAPFSSFSGLVRTRWSGYVWLSDEEERPDGSILVALEKEGEEGATLVLLDRELRERWSRHVRQSVIAGPPHWSRGLLFFDGEYRLLGLDEAGRGERRGVLPAPQPFSARGYRGAAIGQAPSGEWYVAVW